MIWFSYPYVLLILPSILGIMYLRKKRGWGKPASLVYPETDSTKAAFKGGRRPGSGWRESIRYITIGLLIISSAGPKMITHAEHYRTSGLDIMLCLDISGSMIARDFEPLNRLMAAKEVITRFINRARHDRIGLVAFAARAYQICPLTVDYPVLLMLMNNLETGMTTDGTAIGMAMTAAINRLKDTEALSKVIILLTDGQNNAGQLDPITASEIAAALKIKIYTIGIGREGGAPIRIKDATGEEKLLLNRDGSVHYEEIDEALLDNIARITGGKYYRAFDKEKLSLIYEEIRKMEKSRLDSKRYRSYRDIGHWFMLMAGILFMAEIILSFTRERRMP